MPATVVIIVKLMPESPSVDLNTIREKAQEALTLEGAKNISFEEKPIAFGLKAIFIKMAWPEEISTELIESSLSKIENVSSVTIEDYRRAFG